MEFPFLKKIIAANYILATILILAIVTRFWNLYYPNVYIFDEVYHAFTAQAYAQNDPRGYEWWRQSPVKGTAYEWLHPPLAKLFIALGILIFGDNSFGWRFFSAIFGVLAIYLLYLVGKQLFNKRTGLIASFLGCLDGLLLVQSRIAMNDIFLAVFILAAVYFLSVWFSLRFGLVNRRRGRTSLALCFIFTGLAVATKWPGIFLVPIIGLAIVINLLSQENRFVWLKKNLLFFSGLFLLVPIIYVLSYGQFWLQGHTLKQFITLHKQIWWYQTSLKATHDYGSKAWAWPFLIRPVWYYVDYHKDRIGNIFALGNPLIWWTGLPAMLYVFYKAIKKFNSHYSLLVTLYLVFWLPWLFSPRVMFLYHYLPSLSFLILGLAFCLEKISGLKWVKIGVFRVNGKLAAGCWLLAAGFVFFLFFPYWTGIAISQNYRNLLLWLSSWK